MTQFHESLALRMRAVVQFAILALAATVAPAPARAQADATFFHIDGGFEGGLAAPWGTGRVLPGETKGNWTNFNKCVSAANADRAVNHSGEWSLHIVNRTARAPHVYGTTQQPLSIEPRKRYGISLWAKANGLRSTGAVSLMVDESWRVRPIQLPAGSYDWTPFTGEFSLPDAAAMLRIVSEDVGEVWIDDLEIFSLEREPPAKVESVAVPAPAHALPSRLQVLLGAVGRFREQSLRDVDLALAELADEAVRREFTQLSERLWPYTDPKLGWSYFFSYAVVVPVRCDSSPPLVAFIHPWSDVVLITGWECDERRARLEGINILPAEFLRHPTLKEQSQVPAWIGDPIFKPAAVAQHAARTIAAFETTFAPSPTPSWQDIPLNRKMGAATKVHLDETCAALLIESLARVQILQRAQDGEPAILGHLRSETRTFLESAAAGRIDVVLTEATETLPATKDVLLKLTPQRISRMTVVSTLVGRSEGMVFLAPWDEPGIGLSLHITSAGSRPQTKRIDVISFAAAYQQFAKNGEKP